MITVAKIHHANHVFSKKGITGFPRSVYDAYPPCTPIELPDYTT